MYAFLITSFSFLSMLRFLNLYLNFNVNSKGRALYSIKIYLHYRTSMLSFEQLNLAYASDISVRSKHTGVLDIMLYVNSMSAFIPT